MCDTPFALQGPIFGIGTQVAYGLRGTSMGEHNGNNDAEFLAELPTAVRQKLERLFVSEAVTSGTTIFREGQVEKRVFLIVSGQIALEMDVPGRGRRRILSLGPGDYLGWSPLFGDSEMTATAIAIEPSELLAASGEELRTACQRDPELGYHLMRYVAIALSRRLVATRLQLLDLFEQDVPIGERLMAAP